MGETTSKKILDSALTAMLKGLELSPCIKVPATFIAELAKRFSTLQPDEKRELGEAAPQRIISSLPPSFLADSSPKPDVLATYIQKAIDRAKLLDYVYGLATPALNELICRIDRARANVSDTAPRRSQVSQLIDWLESSEGPGIEKLAEMMSFCHTR